MKYECHCIIHLYDGVKTTVEKQIQHVEAENEEAAELEIKNRITNRYRPLSHLSLSSVQVTVNPSR